MMGRAGPRPRPIISKFDRPGRAAAHEMRALHGPLCPAHEAAHVYGPVRAAAHEMCTTANTTSTSILPMRRPTRFHGSARAASRNMCCTSVLLRSTIHYYFGHYYHVRPAHEAAHGLSRAETRAGPRVACTKKSRRAVCCDKVFSRAGTPSAYPVSGHNNVVLLL